MKPFILFVCTGNICRSPMAATLFEAQAEKMGEGDVYEVQSAGTWGLDGQQAAEYARAAMAKRGLSLENHRARTVTREMLDEASVVLVMTEDHFHALTAEFPDARKKIHQISEFSDRQYDIVDPYGGPPEEYELCATELAQLIERGYPRIASWVAAAPSPEIGTS